MKIKTARRILMKRAWEITEAKLGGVANYKRWLTRLEAKCIETIKKK